MSNNFLAKKCPFCGSDNVDVIRFRPNDTELLWVVECYDCEERLLCKTEEEAMVACNSMHSEAAKDLPRLKDLYAALTYCGSKNKFPSIEESCRKELCPLFPFRWNENTMCVTCIETVFRKAADVVKNILDEQSETE